MVNSIQILFNKVRQFDFQILKKQILSITFKITSILFTFILTKYFISELGFHRYGDYVLINGYLIVISALIGTGYGMLALEENSLIKGFDYKVLLKLTLSVLINIFFFSILFLLINNHYNFFSNKLVYSIISFSLSSFLIEIIRAKTNGNIYIFFKDVSRSIILLIFIFLIPSKDNTFLINLSSLIVLLVILIYLIILFFKHGIETKSTKFYFKDLYIKGWSIALVASSQFLKIRLDIFLAGIFFNKSIVGMYDVLMKLGQLIKLPEVALNADIAKQFAISIKLNQYSNELKKRIKITKVLGYVLGVFCIIISPFYLEFYGYDVTISSIVIAIILLLANTVNCYYGPLGLFVQLSSLKKYFLKVITIFILLTVILSYLIVPVVGIFALAITNFIIAILWNHFIHKKIHQTYNFKV